jgi:dicarboxylate/amino acid:cation (Na+ or H+) symporter, DAACS family
MGWGDGDDSNAGSMMPVSRRSGSIFGISLPTQMLLGLVVGCIVGVSWPTVGKELLPLAQVFIKALRMLVIPLVFSSIALGVYNMGREISVVGRVIGIAFVWFYLATGACVVIGLVMNGIFHPGIGADLTGAGGKVPANAGLSVNWVEFLLDLVPANVVGAMAEQKVLQVLLFGMLFGGALSTIGDLARPVIGVLQGVQAAVMKMVRWIIAFAPVAVAGAMAWLLSTQGTGALTALAKLVGTLYVGLAVVILLMCLVLYGIGENPFAVIRKIAEPLLLAFTTRSSEVTLPIHMEILERLGVPNKIVSTVIPLGYSFNQDGTSLYVSLAVAFVVEAHNIHLGLRGMITIIVAGLITTKGMGNVGGGGLIAATTVLVSMGLPVEAIAIIAGIDVFMDMGRTTVNVMGNTVAVLLVRKFGHVKDDEMSPAPQGAQSEHVA